MEKSGKKELDQKSLENLFRPLSDDQIENLTPKQLKILLRGEQQIRQFFEEAYRTVEALNKELEDKMVNIEGLLVKLKNRLFCPQSERRNPSGPSENDDIKGPPPIKKPVTRERNLQERYKNADVIDREIRLEVLPTCECCQHQMSEMGVFEQSQHITVIPKKYLITNILRMKYRCTHCHGSIKTAPPLPKIIPRSTYGDSLLIDASISKFGDLIPIERYCEMATQGGFKNLPPNTLHTGIWKTAIFLHAVYELIRIETLDSRILSGDETGHNMLEGHERKKWYLWGFFGTVSCFYECHPSRAGAIAGDILSKSGCEVFMSDAYNGYSTAIKTANELRIIAGLSLIIEALCNAHARRYFDECPDEIKDAKQFITFYQQIYQLEKKVKHSLPEHYEEAKEYRQEMKPIFENMKEIAEGDLDRYSSASEYYGACQYYLNNYDGLTACLQDPHIPLDNNHSERGLRKYVVGRKTWYGTHSERGAEATCIHLTIIESCKMNGINPREYYKAITEAIHFKKPLFTPFQFKREKNIPVDPLPPFTQ